MLDTTCACFIGLNLLWRLQAGNHPSPLWFDQPVSASWMSCYGFLLTCFQKHDSENVQSEGCVTEFLMCVCFFLQPIAGICTKWKRKTAFLMGCALIEKGSSGSLATMEEEWSVLTQRQVSSNWSGRKVFIKELERQSFLSPFRVPPLRLTFLHAAFNIPMQNNPTIYWQLCEFA